jgi:hypothetical protein
MQYLAGGIVSMPRAFVRPERAAGHMKCRNFVGKRTNKHGLRRYFQNNYFAKLAPVLAKEIENEG